MEWKLNHGPGFHTGFSVWGGGGGDVVCGLTKMDKITKYFSRKRPRLKKKLILMKFWTFLKKKIGALDCNWCIILFLCKEMSLGGDQRFGGGGGGISQGSPPCMKH